MIQQDILIFILLFGIAHDYTVNISILLWMYIFEYQIPLFLSLASLLHEGSKETSEEVVSNVFYLIQYIW